MDVEQRVYPSSAAPGRRIDLGRLPLRARKLIEAACTLCDHWAEPTLRLCLERFDKRLYEQAEQSRNHLEQQRCFDSRNFVQHGRTAFIQSFSAKLRESFECLGETDDDQTSQSLSLQSLTLLDRTEHELTAALDKLAARSEAQNGPILSELSYRLAVLVATPPLEGRQLPLGPQNMARILRIASEPMNLPLEHRLLLLQVFESSVGRTLVSLYEGINAKLLADGILPQLRAFTAARATHGPAHASVQGPTPAQPATPADPAERSNEPIAVLETLRDLLTRQRVAASGSAQAAGARTATPEELQTALGALQQHMVQVTDRTSRELRSAQRLQEELLYQLNLNVPPGAAHTQLTPEQGDTVELVAMLFEQLSQQLHHGPDARALLGNLQLPLLRLAVADRDFFNQQEHPARQLLGKLADTIDTWLDGPNGETDQQLLAKLSHLVDRAQQEPPTAGLYTSLLADIEHHLMQLVRKSQAAERRHVEAMQGREKLEQARRRADELMAERFSLASPRGLLRTLLERAWTDVLALTLLRHDEHSEAFLHQLRITDQLLGQFPVNDPLALRQEVETGLQQIGMHQDEAEQVAQRLISAQMPATVSPLPAPLEPPTTAAAEPVTDKKPEQAPVPTTAPPVVEEAKPQPPPRVTEVPSATDLAIRLKQRQRLGEHRNEEAPSSTHAAVVPPLGLREARIHNHLRQLPFGTWFEFTDPATGRAMQQKLAWFSPLSGNSLFVNRRGQRSDVMNLQELARAIAEGRVRELPPQQENLLDRAWHALTNSLLRPAPLLPEARS
ncbi:DUF1631 family protein [Dyella nitratireducens]|uniref:DUF1631 family protein n=1 Tax=Dyella nitratireducens TaxID=1849580 RepID=A0ABQ1FNH1_9GAMM|nr:DUF1631 family protein [Dyella nitratireducens]GGA23919.1 hypothetical protein GCM10010981_10360 [Dyella nitratireducens]GLQ43901.1 hypothetical protein GCM10007902_37510 [Dyella nitratireducens]